METSNIGTLNALADPTKPPFEQSAAKTLEEPKATDAAWYAKVSYVKPKRLHAAVY